MACHVFEMSTMKVAYTEMKDACLDRVAVEGIRFDCVCCHFYFYAVSCYFLAFSLLAYKVRAKNNLGKEIFYEKKWERFRKRSQNLQTF